MPPIPPDQISPYEGSASLTDDPLISSRGLATYYSVHLNTIPRWRARGVIPPPDLTINNRHYWYTSTIRKADRERTKAAAKHRFNQKSGQDSEPPPAA